jgi:hypothetical protein
MYKEAAAEKQGFKTSFSVGTFLIIVGEDVAVYPALRKSELSLLFLFPSDSMFACEPTSNFRATFVE